MSRSRLTFFLIIGSAILLIIGYQIYLRIAPSLPQLPTSTPVPALRLTIAVNTLAYDWVSEQARAFNARQPRVEGQPVEIVITRQDGLDVWNNRAGWSTATHPVAWIPEATFVISYAADAGLNYQTLTASVASTPLVWGIFADRAAVITKSGGSIDWEALQAAAAKESWQALGGQANWRFVKPAFSRPDQNMAGLAALMVAAASYHKSAALTEAQLADREFQRWLEPVIDAVPSFASLGAQPAETIAARGESVADFALLPESEWVQRYDRLAARQGFVFAYPAYKLVFDMPFAIWAGPETTSAARTALQQFSDALMQETVQKQAITYGLRPGRLPLDSTIAPRFSAAGLELSVIPGQSITAPARNGALGLLNWFKSFRRAP